MHSTLQRNFAQAFNMQAHIKAHIKLYLCLAVLSNDLSD